MSNSKPTLGQAGNALLSEYIRNFSLQMQNMPSPYSYNSTPICCPNCYGRGKMNVADMKDAGRPGAILEIEWEPCPWCAGFSSLAIPWQEWAGRDEDHVRHIDQRFKVMGKGAYFSAKSNENWRHING